MWEQYYSRILESGVFDDVESRCLLQIYNYIFDNFANNVKSALELGCGIGRFSLMISRRCQGAIGIDLHIPKQAKEFFEAGSQKMSHLIADARNLPFKADSFDFVHSQGFYEHFAGEEKKAVLEESIRVLRRGGLLFFSVPNSLNILYRIGKFISRIKGTWIFGSEKPLDLKETLTGLRKLRTNSVSVGGMSFVGQLFDIPTVRRLVGAFGIDYRVLVEHLEEDWGFGVLHAVLGRQIFVLVRKTRAHLS